MNINELLQKSVKILAAKKIDSANIDAELLLLRALDQSNNKPKSFYNDRSWLIAHNDYALTVSQKNKFLKFIKRREKYEPIAYITNKKEFYGLEFYVDKNVLIPRPETEILVENALKEISDLYLEARRPSKKEKIIIADIGAGSGAIAISITSELIKNKSIKNCKIFATDISAQALKIAKQNAKTHNCFKNITFKKGNLLKALPKNTKIDFLLANLPYGDNDYLYKRLKDKSKLHFFFGLKYEPKISIFADKNGIAHFENLFKNISLYLAKNAKIFLESDPQQIPAIKKLAKKYLPKHEIKIFKDLRGLDRITKIRII